MKKIITLALLSILIYACGTSKKTANDTISKEAEEASKETNVEFDNTNKMTALEEGEAIFNNQCTLCHDQKKITDYSYEQWVEIVADMSQKVNKKLKREELGPMDEANLLRYIKSEM